MWKKQIEKPTIIKRQKHDKSFKNYIKELSKEKDFGERLTTRELAKRVGIDYEMFRKILNKRKPNQPRDCIIAICAALFCSVEETNKALFYYDDMPSLDPSEGYRDYFIRSALEASEDKSTHFDYAYKGVELVNKILDDNNFSKLRLSNKIKSVKSNENVKNKIKHISSEKYSEREKFNSSLGEFYKPYNYSVGTTIEVDYHGESQYIRKNSDRNEVYIKSKNGFSIKVLDKETEMFKEFSPVIDNVNLQELKKCYEVLYDTRNWGFRKSAKIKDASIVVYGEQFNYYIPDRNEYFYAEIKKGKFSFSVFKTTMFMREYLTKDEFKSFYSKKRKEHQAEVQTFYSINEIKEYCEKLPNNFFDVRYSYISYFEIMKEKLENLLINIKNKKELIRDFNVLPGDDPYEIYYFFNVQDEFECIEEEITKPVFKEYNPFEEDLGLSDDKEIGSYLGEEKYIERVSKKKEAVFEFKNKKVILTREDLITAFELGLNNIEDVLNLKSQILDFETIYEK